MSLSWIDIMVICIYITAIISIGFILSKKASKNIAKFHEKQIPSEWYHDSNGIKAGQIIRPINSVGCYIPGGRAVYPSSILMTVIPAKIAGVERIYRSKPFFQSF